MTAHVGTWLCRWHSWLFIEDVAVAHRVRGVRLASDSVLLRDAVTDASIVLALHVRLNAIRIETRVQRIHCTLGLLLVESDSGLVKRGVVVGLSGFNFYVESGDSIARLVKRSLSDLRLPV